MNFLFNERLIFTVCVLYNFEDCLAGKQEVNEQKLVAAT
jgi:hypothetical protein